MRINVITALFGLLAVPTVLTACGDDCADTATCGPYDGPDAATGGASGGVGGTSGTGGSSASGGASGGTGGSGTGGASGDGGGTGGSSPCNGECSGSTPICKEADSTCVECTGMGHCAAPTSICNTGTNTCVECLTQTDCSSVASRCVSGACQPCETNPDCAHIQGKTVCDQGECVECTGTDYTVCGLDGMSRQRVCDTLNRSCSTQTERSQGLCQSCVSDPACSAGQRCVLQTFGNPSQDVGYFCFWKRGDTANGAPALCSSAQPYVRTLSAAVSIDGETLDLCGLRTSTCVARNEFSSKDCTSGAVGDDSLCGFDPPNDAKCITFDVGVFQCTMTCLGSQDCPPGSSCNTSVAQPYCEL
jgi:hypothetical protein